MEFRLKTGIDSVASNFKASHDTITAADIFKLSQAKDHQKEVDISYSDLQGALGLYKAYDESLVLSIFRENFTLNHGIFSNLRPGETLNVTIDLDWVAQVIDDVCADATYNEDDFTMITFKGKGATFAVRQKKCMPCIVGETCGVDAYDIDKATKNSVKANKAFFKLFDLAFFTGKKLVKAQDGTRTLADYPGLGFNFTQSLQALPANTLGKSGNIISDIIDTITFIHNKIDDSLMSSTDPLAELKNRNLEHFSLWVSYSALADIQKINMELNNPIELFSQKHRLNGFYNFAWAGKLTAFGIDVIAVPDNLMPAGTCAAIFDNASFTGDIACVNEIYMGKGTNHMRSNEEYFDKSWTVYMSPTAELGIGNFSYKIPCRDCQVKTLADNTCNDAAGPTGTQADPIYTTTSAA